MTGAAAIPFDMPDTEVARIFSEQDLVSAPVVDDEGRLLGRITIDDVVDVVIEERGWLDVVRDALGLDVLRVIPTGGNTLEQAREQWDDGNNVLTLAPGVVVAYDRNIDTNARLQRAGIEALGIAALVSFLLGLILAFIGVKLILTFGHELNPRIPEIPTFVSLAVIIVVLAVTTIASLLKVRHAPGARAHSGPIAGHGPAHETSDQQSSDRG